MKTAILTLVTLIVIFPIIGILINIFHRFPTIAVSAFVGVLFTLLIGLFEYFRDKKTLWSLPKSGIFALITLIFFIILLNAGMDNSILPFRVSFNELLARSIYPAICSITPFLVCEGIGAYIYAIKTNAYE